ncbi:hypothetical protein [Comamonas sp. JC664]|uniref:hypothetical protein n=1 Tax=Comamonas sp. JC664 TaxID=2801917 RepID=UPI00174E31A4|nr:hypothetical protein [Comamonas sp. JC664]MBL0695695.1 hypothetical protein [Comamonas sp. JC664]GHG62980.1 hypothetical protein GCM10012319_02160 [Comamonas sp. KCTC 72670]
MSAFARILACGLLPTALLTAGCGPEGGPDEAASRELVTPVQSEGNAGVLVSTELFDIAARWSSESVGAAGPVAAAVDAGKVDLLSYVRRHAPELAPEAESVLARAPGAEGQTGAMQTACSCQVWGTFDKPSASPSGGGWQLHFRGAAHSGQIGQNLSGTLREQTTDSAVYTTQFRTRMNCSTASGQACPAGCSAKLYSDILYSSQIDTVADTGGIWSKGATAQVAEGVTLDFRTPFSGAGSRLFEKAAAISHYASSTTFNVDELANLLKSALSIYTVIQTGDITKITSDLIDQAVKAIAGLIHRSGADGSTSRGMVAQFESPFWQPISLSYSSTDHLYYSFDLASHVRMKTRGYGGWHKAEGRVASSASIVAYVDNFVCDAGVSPPGRIGFWRYDAFDNAPVPMGSLQDRVRNFLSSGLGRWVDVSWQEGVVQ